MVNLNLNFLKFFLNFSKYLLHDYHTIYYIVNLSHRRTAIQLWDGRELYSKAWIQSLTSFFKN